MTFCQSKQCKTNAVKIDQSSKDKSKKHKNENMVWSMFLVNLRECFGELLLQGVGGRLGNGGEEGALRWVEHPTNWNGRFWSKPKHALDTDCFRARGNLTDQQGLRHSQKWGWKSQNMTQGFRNLVDSRKLMPQGVRMDSMDSRIHRGVIQSDFGFQNNIKLIPHPHNFCNRRIQQRWRDSKTANKLPKPTQQNNHFGLWSHVATEASSGWGDFDKASSSHAVLENALAKSGSAMAGLYTSPVTTSCCKWNKHAPMWRPALGWEMNRWADWAIRMRE